MLELQWSDTARFLDCDDLVIVVTRLEPQQLPHLRTDLDWPEVPQLVYLPPKVEAWPKRLDAIALDAPIVRRAPRAARASCVRAAWSCARQGASRPRRPRRRRLRAWER